MFNTHHIFSSITLLGELQAGQLPAALLVHQNDLWRDVSVDRFEIVVQVHQRFGKLFKIQAGTMKKEKELNFENSQQKR